MYALSPVLLSLISCLTASIAGAATVHGEVSSPVAQIIHKSLNANSADWRAQPEYAFNELDVKSKIDSGGTVHTQESKTYEVTMVNGSPYNRLIAVNNEPLSKAQERAEQAKLERETYRRQRESNSDKKARVSKYEAERREEHMLMEQITEAFRFTLAGTERVEGIECYVLDATPNPSYRPPVEKARVLTGMKGRLWVDTAHYHWVRVRAEVISPVEFGLFLAKVKPGTQFELEQAPVGDVWLPKRFTQTVNATVLGFYGMRSKEEEHYSNYHQQLLRAENPSLTH